MLMLKNPVLTYSCSDATLETDYSGTRIENGELWRAPGRKAAEGAGLGYWTGCLSGWRQRPAL
jgi:hypothetical protein